MQGFTAHNTLIFGKVLCFLVIYDGNYGQDSEIPCRNTVVYRENYCIFEFFLDSFFIAFFVFPLTVKMPLILSRFEPFLK
jgi:hypothetical protein